MITVSHDLRDELYSTLGKKIREAREKRGLTQAELAGTSSLSRTSITNIEHGRQHLPLHTLYDVAIALEVDVAELLPRLSKTDEGLAEKIPEGLDQADREWIEAIVSSK